MKCFRFYEAISEPPQPRCFIVDNFLYIQKSKMQSITFYYLMKYFILFGRQLSTIILLQQGCKQTYRGDCSYIYLSTNYLSIPQTKENGVDKNCFPLLQRKPQVIDNKLFNLLVENNLNHNMHLLGVDSEKWTTTKSLVCEGPRTHNEFDSKGKISATSL